MYDKLLKIQGELKAPKGQVNKFGGYNYRSCEDILEALKPLLAKNKCILTINDTIELIGDRYYIKATATLIDTETGDTSTATAYAREEESKKGMDSSQLTGSTSSYARKYALNGLFAIDDTKDSDATNTHEGATLSDKQIARLYAIANSKGISKATVDAQVMKKFNKEVSKLNKVEYDTVVTGYENIKGGK